MGRELYMVGIVVQDMSAAVTFYRRLGLTIPEGSEKRTHVQVPMGDQGFTFFLDARPSVWDPAFVAGEEASTRSYSTILEFYLKTQAAVDATYAEMLEYGYQSHAAPYNNGFGMYFAIIKDPDGNAVLLSGDLDNPTPEA